MTTLANRIEAVVAEEMHILEQSITNLNIQTANQRAVILELRAHLQIKENALYKQKKANAEMAAYIKALLVGAQNTTAAIVDADNAAEFRRVAEQLAEPKPLPPPPPEHTLTIRERLQAIAKRNGAAA